MMRRNRSAGSMQDEAPAAADCASADVFLERHCAVGPDDLRSEPEFDGLLTGIALPFAQAVANRAAEPRPAFRDQAFVQG